MEESTTHPSSKPTLKRLKRTLIPERLQKKRQVKLAKTKRKSQEELSAIRITSCIFKSPVTKVTSHPSNVVKYNKNKEMTLKKPQQVSAYKKLDGFQVYNSEGEILRALDPRSVFKISTPKGPGDSLRHGAIGSQPTSFQPTTTQSSSFAELLSGKALIHCRKVTEEDIYRQSLKVKDARERLTVAMKEVQLALEAESEECAGGSTQEN